MSKRVKKRSSRPSPLYKQTAEALSALLETMHPGDNLPSEPKLAEQLGVSRATLREAMRIFENQGRIIRRQGIGTFVSQPIEVIESGLEELESIEAVAARIGLDVEMGELEFRERRPDEEEAAAFGVTPQTSMLEIARIILAKGRPVAYLIDILPHELLPFELQDERFRGSILDLFLRKGQPELAYSRAEVTAIPASGELARSLKIQRGDVLLCMESWLYTKEGHAVDHTYSYFLPGTFRFHILRRVRAI
jgi:GntR family transcriptional regulator